MGFASGSRDAVLSTLCEDVAANGTAPLLTGLSFADIAATAGVSASSVRRAVRTLDRLDALVSRHLGRAGIDTRADLRLSGAPRERRLHPGQPGAIAGVIDAAIDMQSNPRSLPSAALWGRLHIPHVRAARREVMLLLHFSLSQMTLSGLAFRQQGPAAPYDSTTLTVAGHCVGLGSVTLASRFGEVVPRSDAATALLDFFTSATGDALEPPQVLDAPHLSRPEPISPATRHAVDTSIELLRDRGTPGPFGHYTARDIADLASVSVGTLYRQFDQLDDVHAAALDHFLTSVEQRLEAVSSGGLELVVDGWAATPGLLAVLLSAQTTSDTAALQRCAEHYRTVIELVASAGPPAADGASHDNSHRRRWASRAVATCVGGYLHGATVPELCTSTTIADEPDLMRCALRTLAEQ